jgi:hypothetical protein
MLENIKTVIDRETRNNAIDLTLPSSAILHAVIISHRLREPQHS